MGIEPRPADYKLAFLHFYTLLSTFNRRYQALYYKGLLLQLVRRSFNDFETICLLYAY